METKKAAIIGGLEFIGSYIILKFLAEGYTVKIQVSRKSKYKNDPFFRNICSNGNLKVFTLDLENPADLQSFVEDCEVIVHCGYPFKLELEAVSKSVYVPVIKGTRNLLKAIKTSDMVQKVIFITSVAALHSEFISPKKSGGTEKNKLGGNNTQHTLIERAKYHANKAEYKMIDDFPESLFEIIYVYPFVVNDPFSYTNSHITSSLGLKFIFKKNITRDTCFQKIVKRHILDRIENINDLPDRIFTAATRNDL